jgi:DNA repair exonuclease SbcCD ATPase subunit
MAGITRTFIRVSVIGGLLVGGAVVIAGPHRVGALAQQMRGTIVSVIDSQIDDPIAMRGQLRDLEAKYPKRISQVRSHLAEISEQLRQINRDAVISDRVVEMAHADYNELRDLIARAESADLEFGGAKLVAIAFKSSEYDITEAYTRANSIADTATVYANRYTDLERDKNSLERDQQQLENLLGKLESEHAQFRAQIAQLDGQIDSIARKQKMVKIMEERQTRIDELSRYEVASLDQFKANLAKRQAELEGKLDTYSRAEGTNDYVERARFEIDAKTTVSPSRFERLRRPVRSKVVIDGSESFDTPTSDDDDVVASRNGEY